MALVKLQLGKKGLTKEFIGTIRNSFKITENIRINILKHATRDKAELKQWADEILKALGRNYTCKTIGYTIVLRKWRKAR